jgi:peptidoglycan/LPS O-acetylase OafA/YrhL
MEAKRFIGLDGLRGVCAITVMLFHCNDLFHSGPIFQHGFLAVDMFFILSGFVIALTYEERLKAGFKLKTFLRARAKRLLPVYWLGALLNIAIFIFILAAGYVVIPGYTPKLVAFVSVTTLILIPQFLSPDNSPFPPMSIAWSLFMEWVANLLYASGAFRLKTPTLLAITAVGWGLMTVTGYRTGFGWCIGVRQTDFIYSVLRAVPGFFAGVVIFRGYEAKLFDRLPAIAPELLLTLWLVIAVVPAFTATPTFDAVAAIALCPLLLVLLIRSDEKAPSFCKPMGALSYPLYTTHRGILLLAQATPLFGLDKHPDPIRALAVVVLCMAEAWGLMKITTPKAKPLKPAYCTTPG